MITKDKVDQLKNNINDAVTSHCWLNLPSLLTDGEIARQFKFAIEEAIARTVKAGFNELLDNLYTQENLENDLNLNQ